MHIKRSGSQPSAKGPAEYFTGTVRIDAPFAGEDPARIGGATVTFEPGARTAWHTHPLGQTLIVTAGYGWAQREGGPDLPPDHFRIGADPLVPFGQLSSRRPRQEQGAQQGQYRDDGGR